MGLKMFAEDRKDKKRKIMEGIQESNTQQALSSIYKDEEGKDVDMTKMERTSRFHFLKVVGVTVLILGALSGSAYAGMKIFQKKYTPNTPEKTAKISVKTPETIASGEKVTFEITLENLEKNALKESLLNIQYPEGWYLERTEPQAVNDTGTQIEIPSLASGGAMKIKLEGQILGEVDTTKEFSVAWRYQPTNFSSDFEKEKSWFVRINSSILSVALDMPQRALPEQDIPLKIQYQNTSQIKIPEIKIELSVPQEFTLKKSDPAPAETLIWYLKDVESSASGTIKVDGSIDATAGKEIAFTTKLSIRQADGSWTPQIEKQKLLLVIHPDVTLRFTLNDEEEGSTLQIGDLVNYKVQYENTTDLALENVVIELRLKDENKLLDQGALVSQSGKPKQEENVLRWTSEQDKKLALVAPGEKNEIIWSLPLQKTLKEDQKPKNVAIEHTVELRYESGDADIPKELLKFPAKKITTKIKTQTKVIAEARYYADDRTKLGSGPVPPEANATTTYRVFWYVTNTFNEIKNIEVKAKLPADATWVENAQTKKGDIRFDTGKRTVIWKIESVPAHTSGTALSAFFDIAIHPTQDDVGKVMVITDKAIFTAEDVFTKEKIAGESAILTSDLESDPYAKGKGEVGTGASPEE